MATLDKNRSISVQFSAAAQAESAARSLIGAIAGFALAALTLVSPSTAQAIDILDAREPAAEMLIRNAAFGPLPSQRLDVYVPAEAGDEPRPILLFFHGGFWTFGSKTGSSAFAGKAFAARGFVVAVPNYRLYPEVRYPSFVEDCAAAVAWAYEHAAEIGGDPDRIVLVGYSAGAYNAAMLALDRRWLEAVGVPNEAIVGWAGLAGPYDLRPYDLAARSPFGAAANLETTQPINHVDATDPPALIATGTDDHIVDPEQMAILVELLGAAGVRVESRAYQGIGHVGIGAALLSPFQFLAPVLDDVAEFLWAAARRPHR